MARKSNKVKDKDQFDFDKYEFSKTDKKIFILLLENPYAKQSQIAKELNLSEAWVSRSISKPVFQNALQELHGNWISKLMDAKERAADRLIALVDCTNERIALDASKSILQIDKLDLSNTEPENDNF